MHATYVTRAFPRHVHDGFALGVVERGALGFYYRGSEVIAPAGSVNLANPDEIHTGRAAARGGWTYRMIYFSAELLGQVAAQMAGRTARIPFFPMGVIHDARLALMVRAFHRGLERDPVDPLWAQAHFLRLFSRLIRHYADSPPPLTRFARHTGVARAHDFLRAHATEALSLDALAAVAGLSPFHFTRAFADAYGLPPHAYLTQLRIHRAKALLIEGGEIAQVAQEAGFSDQSHLNRLFKRFTGLTPGQYKGVRRRPGPRPAGHR